jgi:hypothetical protein
VGLWRLGPFFLFSLSPPPPAPRARAGQTVAIEIDGIGRIENPFVAERD